jgi:hypothetical protein
MYGKMSTPWRESGFLRRFLRMQYTLKDERALLDAIHKWEKIGFELPTHWNGKLDIKYNLDEKESKWIMNFLRDQPDSTPTVLLKKICVVLKKRKPDHWQKIIADVAPGFGQKGALLEL